MNYDDHKLSNPWDEDRMSRAAIRKLIQKQHPHERQDTDCPPENNSIREHRGDDDKPMDNRSL
jgi:hypothetical protein